MRVIIIFAIFLFCMIVFGIYLCIHWRNRCRNRLAEKARRREAEMETSCLSEEWAELEKELGGYEGEGEEEDDDEYYKGKLDLTRKNK